MEGERCTMDEDTLDALEVVKDVLALYISVEHLDSL